MKFEELGYVFKRNGAKVPFDIEKIVNAIKAAGVETKEFDEEEARHLAFIVKKILTHRFDRQTPEIEKIQDIVEQVLINENYFRTARAYILYREKRGEARRDKKNMVDVVLAVNEYLDKLDWRVNANANQGYSLGGMILNISGKMVANYWLNRVYPEYISMAHRNGDFHIHDLDMLSGYCAGWSLRTVLNEGFNGVPGKAEARPPKHFSSALGQMVNFLGTLQNEWAGAQAFSSFDTYLAPFVKVDKLSYDQVKQNMQEFIYNLNVPSRWGTQTPFTNLTFDWVCPDDLKDKVPLIGGEEVDFTYGDVQAEMDLINRAFMEVMTEGDCRGRVFTFPIPTYNITKSFNWDTPNADLLFGMTAKYGLPYFQNYVNSDLDPASIRSMCCRLQLDLRELLKRGNSLFGSAEQTGSIGVVTINCARLGYVYKGNEDALVARLYELMDYARKSLEIKRKVIQMYMDNGLFPFTKRYLGRLKNHFSTIGVNGINEMIRNFTDDQHDITTDYGQQMALRILDKAREKLLEFQAETGNMYNLEATPGEGATYRFAKEDLKRFPDILHAGTAEKPYYTNSSQLPVGFSDDAFEALKLQDDLQRKYTGGTVFHLYMSEKISSPTVCKKLVRKVVENFKLPYFSITPTFSICPVHGYLAGEHKFCPKCDAEIVARKKNEETREAA
ncbi:MAG: ribonucleoside triphosphate reductase [Alphaproteobacteria bacterium]|nr:ribonucleoside triphosphate reductase [Alphaproteobacteria bacterium]MBO7536764.1 ribonucleoside triphosphate reductase [Alphaproteobacteria bacterium]MBO7642172.1 ribonucleoside triphosphate reductase [Alphaproteobacteria bacterium]